MHSSCQLTTAQRQVGRCTLLLHGLHRSLNFLSLMSTNQTTTNDGESDGHDAGEHRLKNTTMMSLGLPPKQDAGHHVELVQRPEEADGVGGAGNDTSKAAATTASSHLSIVALGVVQASSHAAELRHIVAKAMAKKHGERAASAKANAYHLSIIWFQHNPMRFEQQLIST